MNRLAVRTFRASDVEAAAALAADRHRRDRVRLPFLGAAPMAASAHSERLRGYLANPRAAGVVAERGGTVVGFLFGERQLLAPTEMAYVWTPPFSIDVPVIGHAVAADEDATLAYREMY